LLVLDESTSDLDSESESLVQESLNRLMKGRTTVVIAHRLSTVINADQICVVKEGKIAEIGTHEDLMQKKGFYYTLMSTQVSAFTPEPIVLNPTTLL
jgi:ABC-type multidrug transport system fused ATPase/permease subunit